MENKIEQIVKNFLPNTYEKNLYTIVYGGKIWVCGNLEQIMKVKPQIDRLTKTEIAENNCLKCNF